MRTRPAPVARSILQVLDDPQLLAPHFPREPWRAWRAFLGSVFALPLDAEAQAIVRQHTGRETLPARAVKEAWAIVGRRGGKSRVAALIAVYLATFRDWTPALAPGERGVVMCLAADRRQARVTLRYIAGLLESTPLLAQLIESRTAEAIHLQGRVSVEVHTSSYRRVRGYTIVAALCDELAFWPQEESASPDTETIAALRPAMATVPGSLLVAISSPYARRGALWDTYRQHFSRPTEDLLVWQADTRSMNPLVEAAVIERAAEADPIAASAEYGAEFRADIEGFVRREAVEAGVIPGRLELPPLSGVRYFGFVDPSGGSSDSFTLAIAHRDAQGRGILDIVRERRPPFSPEDVVREFAECCKAYRITTVRGDHYGGEWPRERFRAHGLGYQPSEAPKSELYLGLLPLLNAGRVELLDHPRLHAQLVSLERRTSRAGKDSVDHPPAGHDDVANAVAGALVAACAGVGGLQLYVTDISAPPPAPPQPAEPRPVPSVLDLGDRGWRIPGRR